MVYSRDQWVQLPVKDLYDSQIMLASINAARDMYQRGVDEMKEFKKEYGDFYSPIQKDMNWYTTNVTQGMRDTIEDLYARGIDPLRSAEGRAIISRRINNAPIGEINKLKMASRTAQEYLKNRGILEAQGKFNKDYEDFVNGGKTIEDWDTLKDGIWTRQSPSQFMTLKEATEHWYNNRTPHTLTQKEVEDFGVKFDKRYTYTGFTKNDLLNIAAKNTPGWNGSQIADYYREVAKRQLIAEGVEKPTNKEIEYRLQQNVSNANDEWKVRPVESVNQYAMLDKQQAYQTQARREEFAHQEKMAAAAAARQRESMWLQWKLSNYVPDEKGNPVLKNNQPQIPISFTQQIIEQSNNNKSDNIVGPNNFNKNVLKVSKYWQNKAFNILSKADVNNDGKIDEVEKTKWTNRYNKLNANQKKAYNNAVKHMNWWNTAASKGLGGAVENGLIDKNGNVTSRFTNAMAYTDKALYSGKAFDNGQMQSVNLKYYNGAYTPPTAQHANVLKDILSSGNTSKYSFKDANGKNTYGLAHPVVNFSDRGVYYGPVRANAVASGVGLTKGSLSVKFNKFLKNNGVNGWVVSNSGLGAITVPNRGKGQSIDIIGKVSVPTEVIENFAKSIGKDKNQVIKHLGIRTMDRNGTTKQDGDFAEIPISKQIDNNRGQTYGQIDSSYDKIMFGGSEASKRELERQYNSSQK